MAIPWPTIVQTRWNLRSEYKLNLFTKTGYRLLEISACYDFFQTIVGSTSYIHRILGKTFADPQIRNVIDLGCGTGSKTPFLNSEMKYLGVDISEEYIARASSRDSAAKRTYIVSDLSVPGWLRATDFEQPTLVLAMGIFHHLDDKQIASLLLQLQENIPAGSEITSLDPTITPKTSKAAAFLARQDRGKFLRTPEELENIFDDFGFSTDIHEHRNELRIPYDTILMKCIKK